MHRCLTSNTLTRSSAPGHGSTDKLLISFVSLHAIPRSMNIGATCANTRLHPRITAGLKCSIWSTPKVDAAERTDSNEPKPTMLTRPAETAAVLRGGYSIGGMDSAGTGTADTEAEAEADAVLAESTDTSRVLSAVPEAEMEADAESTDIC